jgi:hypothetical protein
MKEQKGDSQIESELIDISYDPQFSPRLSEDKRYDISATVEDSSRNTMVLSQDNSQT